MSIKIDLKNSESKAIIDQATYDFILSDKHLIEIGFIENLRIHSAGYAVFGKNFPLKDGNYKNETIYLHKLVAEKFVKKHESKQKLFVSFKNNNPLDCRVENIKWLTMPELRRSMNKTKSKTGYRGVSKVGRSFRAVIYDGKERFDLGTFKSPEEAALAYNKKSIELFGQTMSLNVLNKKESL